MFKIYGKFSFPLLVSLLFLFFHSIQAEVNLSRLSGTVVTAKYLNPDPVWGLSNINDGDIRTSFKITYRDSNWIQFALINQYAITQYSVAFGDDYVGWGPKSWTLYGSNDTLSWTVMDQRPSESFPARNLKKYYSLSNSSTFRYYRIVYRTDINVVSIGEIELNQAVPHDVAPVQIISPVPTINGESTIPKILVRNYGMNSESFPVTCQIDSDGVILYSKSQNVSALSSLDSLIVSFPEWKLPSGMAGHYRLKCWTSLGTDLFPIDDTLQKKLNVNNVVFTSFPKPYQLYARGSDDSATASVTGNITMAGPESVSVTLYKNNVQIFHQAQHLTFSGNSASFAFSPRIHAELSMYKFVFRVDNLVLFTSDSVVSGDAFLVDGQSNSCDGNIVPPQPYLRTFGSWLGVNGTDSQVVVADTEWGLAQTKNHNVNGWGMQIAKKIIDNYSIPVCVITGGVGGTSITAHNRSTSLKSIYGQYYFRINKANLANGIKWVIWHQGEQNVHDTTYKSKFLALCDSWKSDFPNIQHYYLFQTRPCYPSGGIEPVREAQRQLPHVRSNISIMASANAPGYSGHYSAAGYSVLANWMYPLVAHDFYGSTDTFRMRPPEIQSAHFMDRGRTKILLKFDQPVFVPADTSVRHDFRNAAFAMGTVRTPMDSIVADTSANTITLYLHAKSDFNYVSYILDTLAGKTYLGPWLYNTRSIGALTFYRFPVQDSANAATSVTFSVFQEAINEISADPNPFNPSVKIKVNADWNSDYVKSHSKLCIFSLNGQIVADLTSQVKNNEVLWNASAYPSGLYLVKLLTGRQNFMLKIILQK